MMSSKTKFVIFGAILIDQLPVMIGTPEHTRTEQLIHSKPVGIERIKNWVPVNSSPSTEQISCSIAVDRTARAVRSTAMEQLICSVDGDGTNNAYRTQQ